jgi:hypothetical protein
VSNSIKARVSNLHNTQAVWETTYIDFVPMPGELVIYDPDETHAAPRFKIGMLGADGQALPLRMLPFVTTEVTITPEETGTSFLDGGRINNTI